jgi:hypothetical protein
VYEYEPGEAMGMPWPTPLIQITATSDDQTDNIYGALRPMIDDGPLAALIPKTGEEFIRLPNKGRIDTVTSNARSRLGQRVTYVPQDETGIWTPQSGMVKVAETQRRGLAGMGGRAEETTNAWDPERGVGRAAHRRSDDRRHLPAAPEAPASLSYRNKAERRKIHRRLPGLQVGRPRRDRGRGRRAAGGRPGAGRTVLRQPAPSPARTRRSTSTSGRKRADLATSSRRGADRDRRRRRPVRRRARDGRDRGRDRLPVAARDLGTPRAGAPDDYEHPFDDVDGVMIEAFERYDVWRAYLDPQYIDLLVDRWQGRWGEKRVIRWYMNRPRQVGYAVRNFTAAIGAGDLSHSGDPVHERHIANARRMKLNVYDEDRRPLHTISKDRPMSRNKMDAAAASVVSWEARGDAIAAGATKTADRRGFAFL